MLDPNLLRTSRELFLSVIAGGTSDMPTWVINRLTLLLEEEEVEAGRRLFAAGEPVEMIYFVREGRIQLSREGVTPWIYEGRWVIGVADGILQRAYRRTAVALSNLSLMKLPVDEWLDLLEDSFELARGVVARSARAVAGLEARRWALDPDPRGKVIMTVPADGKTLSFVDRLAMFSGVGLLQSAGVQVLSDVVSLVREETFEPGERMWARGETPGRTFLLVEGEAVAERVNPNLKVRFGPGSAVAGVAALGETAKEWEAHAVTRARALCLPIEEWFDEMEEHFDLVLSALGALALLRDEIVEDLARGKKELVLG